MKDPIERQEAIEALSSIFAPTPTQKDMVEDCLEIIENLPSTEPKIIRCKECRDYQMDEETYYPNRHYCITTHLVMPENGFCYWAERREDG